MKKKTLAMVLFCCVVVGSPSWLVAQPVNDDYTNRIVLSGTRITVAGSNLGATTEAIEAPQQVFTNSVWWEWTPPADGTLRLSVTSDTFQPAFFVYGLSSSDTNLFYIDSNANTPAEAAVLVYRNVHCMIAVGGLDGGSGEFRLSLEFLGEPTNGTFANRTDLGTGSCQTNGWLFQAESGMAWYSWTAPAAGPATFRVPEDYFEISVLSGTSETNLQLLATSDGRSYPEGAQVTIETQAGVTYVVRVSPIEQGWVNLFTLFVNLNGPPLVALRELPGSSQYVGQTSSVRAETYDSDGRVVQVEFYLAQATWNGLHYSPLSTDSAWPFESVLTNPPLAGAALVAVATDDQGARTMSQEFLKSWYPYNDAFTNRLLLTGSSVRATAWCSQATLEPSESIPPGAKGGSVWFTWTAPFSGALTMQTGLPGSGADTGIQYNTGVFTGSELSALVLVTNGSSPLIFNVSEGTAYQVSVYADNNPFPLHFSITPSTPPTVQLTHPPADSAWTAGSALLLKADAVDDGNIDHVGFYLDASDGSSSFVGAVTNPPYAFLYTVPETEFYREAVLRAVAFDNHGLSANSPEVLVMLHPRPPVNDAFTNPIPLVGDSFNVTGSVLHATLEPGEPNVDASIWYSWTAPSSSPVTLRSPAAAAISVFTGTALDALSTVASAVPESSLNNETRLTFAARAGVEYRIALCAWSFERSPIEMEMIPSAPPLVALTSPTNNAKLLTGTSVILAADTSDDGTVPQIEFYVDGALVGTSTGFPHQCTVVFTNEYGTAWRSAWAVATDDRGLTKQSSPVNLGICGPPPINDSFTNRILLMGSSLSVTGSTASATWEPGEPGTSGDGVVWWSWLAPETALTTVVLGADDYGAQLGIYLAGSVSNRTYVAGTGGNTQPGVTTFKAVAGQEYLLAVSFFRAYGGPVWLVIGQSPPPTVTLTTPEDFAYFMSGDPVLFSAQPMSPVGEVREVKFFSESVGTAVSVVTNPPWSTTLFLTNASRLGETHFQVRARVTDSNGLIGYSEPRIFYVTARRPDNDLFENRLAVEGCSLVVTGSTMNATHDAYRAGDQTVWWSWTAPQDGWVTVDARFSEGSGSFTVLSGSELTSLAPIASVRPGSYESGRVSFPAAAGSVHAIEASTESWRGADVYWELRCGAPAALTITSPQQGAQFRLGSAIPVTMEVETPDGSRPGVELYFDSALVHSVANAPNPVALTLQSLDLGHHNLQVRSVGEYGLVGWSPVIDFIVNPLPPSNDLFSDRLRLSGFIASVPSNTEFATREPGEPDPFAQPGYGTLWYTWKAPASGTLRVQADTGFPLLSIWTGSNLGDLSLVVTNAGGAPVETPVVSGVTYQIACARNAKQFSIFLQTDEYATITDSGFNTRGRFRFGFETLNQQPWVIEASTDLQQWVPISTNSTLRSFFDFVDEQSEFHTRRFYRLTAAQ